MCATNLFSVFLVIVMSQNWSQEALPGLQSSQASGKFFDNGYSNQLLLILDIGVEHEDDILEEAEE